MKRSAGRAAAHNQTIEPIITARRISVTDEKSSLFWKQHCDRIAALTLNETPNWLFCYREHVAPRPHLNRELSVVKYRPA